MNIKHRVVAIGISTVWACSIVPVRAEPPGGINLTVNKGVPPEVDLSWVANPYIFSVYRSSSAANVIAGANLLGNTSSHTWPDSPPAGNAFFYEVTCTNCPTQITYTCECVAATCGNGGAAGVRGNLHTGLLPSDVVGLYGPERIGAQTTGWACLVETNHNSCTCVGSAATGTSCGNGAFVGSNGDTVLNISTANVIAGYGPKRIGNEATGWACHPQDTVGGPVVSYACICAGSDLLGSSCDNGALSGLVGDIFTGLTVTNVIQVFGPDRIGDQVTGWACFPTALNIMSCVGSAATGPFCDNGGAFGTLGDTVSNVSTSDGFPLYGIGRIESNATGWVSAPDSYGP